MGEVQEDAPAQKELPTVMISWMFADPSHDSWLQSRIPLPKSLFVQRHGMSLELQPRSPALPSMFWMHFFYDFRVSTTAFSDMDVSGGTYTAVWQR